MIYRTSLILRPALLFFLSLFLFTGVHASASFYSKEQLSQSFASCMHLFPNQQPLFMQSFSSQMRPTALCSNQFAVLYSKTSKTPLVVVERLNASMIKDAQGEDRTDNFFPDPRLKREDSAQLDDFKTSAHPDLPTDRGHMSPAANAVDPLAMQQSFALSNMIPQNPHHNRKIWSKLESDVRKYVARTPSDVFIYTGPLFDNEPRKLGKSGVWYPSYVYKVMYDPQRAQAWAWILPNSDQAALGAPMSYVDFEKATGLRLLNPAWLR